jgi:integrase
LQLYDETACRLGEVTRTPGREITTFVDDEGRILGGNLHLVEHKTKGKTKEERDIPLSRVAAEILQARKDKYGDGPLFPSLGSADAVCKTLAKVCDQAGVKRLQTKDFRRAFINRNKNQVATTDMMHVVGASVELDLKKPSQGVADTQCATGHKRLSTTRAYTVPETLRLSQAFTATSRNARVLALVGNPPVDRAS